MPPHVNTVSSSELSELLSCAAREALTQWTVWAYYCAKGGFMRFIDAEISLQCDEIEKACDDYFNSLHTTGRVSSSQVSTVTRATLTAERLGTLSLRRPETAATIIDFGNQLNKRHTDVLIMTPIVRALTERTL